MTSNDCLICFQPCQKKRSNIENHKCQCNYYIHKGCYAKWKRTGTDRLCLICQIVEERDHYIEEAQIIIPYHPAEEEFRMNNCRRMCYNVYMWIVFLGYTVYYLYVLYIQ